MKSAKQCKKSRSMNKMGALILGGFLLVALFAKAAEAIGFWDITVIDSNASSPSLAILPSDQPAISYTEYRNDDLKYASFDGGSWQTTTIDSIDKVGSYNSLAILPSGRAAISYYDYTNKDLKYTWFDGSNWQITTVDSTDDVGLHTSLAILPSGQPAISYYDDTQKDLKYACFDGSSWLISTVDSEGDVGRCSSLAILPSGQPAISYYAYTHLKYAWFDGSSWSITTVDSTGNVYTGSAGGSSLSILPSGQPAITYTDSTEDYNEDVKYACFNGTSWQITVVGSVGCLCAGSLAILPSGYPAMSYSDWFNENLNYGWFDGSTWRTTTVDSAGSMSCKSSLVILPSGQPAISYGSDSEVKYATPVQITYVPLDIEVNYTATAHTDRGGTVVEHNSPAYDEDYIRFDYELYTMSSVELEKASGGYLWSVINLLGRDGGNWYEVCVEEDPWTGECMWWDYVCYYYSSRGATGKVTGTIRLQTSEEYPTGSPLYVDTKVLLNGRLSDAENYHLKLWRDSSLISQIDSSMTEHSVVRVFAGETLTFELFASEDDQYDDGNSYHRTFEFRMIFSEPTPLQNYAAFAQHWLEEGCADPDWCGDADLDKSGSVDWLDLREFTDHWPE